MRILKTHSDNTFTAMKPNQFKGFDYACIRKFKAPVEKFNSIEDFNNWAKLRTERLLASDFTSRRYDTAVQRRSIIDEWSGYLELSKTIPAISLIVLTSIMQNLKNNNDSLPPVFNKDVFEKTIDEIKSKLAEEKDAQFNFKKVFTSKLREKLLPNEYKNYTGWVVIPSKSHDEKNFVENAGKLKALSYKTWCTMAYTAITHLEHGDFHIWLDKGKPRIGLRFTDDKISEIQGEKNNGIIELKDFEIVQNYVTENKFQLTGKGENSYTQAEQIHNEIQKISSNLKEAILNNDSEKIFEYFNFSPERLEDGTLSIEEYKSPTEEFSFKELGINEEKLFEQVSEIRGDADFSFSALTSLSNIKRINGDVDFCNSQINDLSGLEFIGGSVNFAYSQLISTQKLKHIGKNANFQNCAITELTNIEHIGKRLSLNSEVVSLGKLKYIGGSVDFTPKSINLENLEEIGENAYFGAGVNSLGNLKYIRGNADFADSNLTDTEKIEIINGILFTNGNLDYSNVEYIETVI